MDGAQGGDGRESRAWIDYVFQLPQLPAFPLEVSYYRGKHDSKIPHLLTTEVKKQIIDDSVFELPKNCKKARFEAEVWVDEKTRDLFEKFQ